MGFRLGRLRKIELPLIENGKAETKFTAEWVNLNGDVFGFKQMESELAASHASWPSILISL